MSRTPRGTYQNSCQGSFRDWQHDALAPVAFGGVLAIVVGQQLSERGLLLVGGVLLAGGFAHLLRLLDHLWRARYMTEELPEVRVERTATGGLGPTPETPRALIELPRRQHTRRGGWPHLDPDGLFTAERVLSTENVLNAT